MKAVLRIATFVLLISFLAACAQPAATPAVEPPAAEEPAAPEAPAATEAPAAEELSAKEQWLKDNQLGPYYTDEQDWAAIEAAAIEEGELLVYANSSKIEKSAEAFMEKYPGITVQAFDLGGDDVLLKTLEEQKAEAFTGDVWSSSGGADLVGNVIPNGYVWRFMPSVVADKIPEQYTQPLLMARLGTSVFAYNSELNDTCPITNVWELTNEEWKGKFFIEDPLNDASTLSKLLTFVGHPEEMKAAYVELYGEEPVLEEDTPDAGWLWLKKFAQNGPIPQPGGDEVDEAFATPGMTDSYMALTSYSNMADVLEGNLAFEPCWGIKPMLGVQSQSYVGIINQAPHPNAAKLWVLWQVSEDGRDPWAKFGTYFTDSTYEVPEGQKPLEEMMSMTWFIDEQFAYDHMIEARDFYLINLSE
ncbi:MAG TPA: ABC transporter substrate-binding protein [Anaerolineaceae bacterium]|nr:ABC transporter substrate-binding protein [Anaerolineaceae bacterium]